MDSINPATVSILTLYNSALRASLPGLSVTEYEQPALSQQLGLFFGVKVCPI